jgi:hypothetical protein
MVLFGGAAGGGKSFLGCYWQLARRLKYPKTTGIIFREELKQLRLTTMVTFWEVLDLCKLKEGRDYTYNGQDHVIDFFNGSNIIFHPLDYRPRDPNYNYLGSLEGADAFIDEAQLCTAKAVNTAFVRLRKNLIGVYPKSDFNEKPNDFTNRNKPKLLMTCNPSVGFLKNDYYSPWKNNELPYNKAFIPSLLGDNTKMKDRDVYEETLKSLSERDYKRLALGDWDYDDSPDLLFDTQSMLQMFTKDVEASGDGYITCDPAAMGNDRTVICLWKGLHLMRFYEYNHKYPHEVADIIRVLATENGVRLNNVIVDADGLGIGVAGLLRCKEFNNGSSAKDSVHYSNLKSECYFKLASMVRDNKVFIHDNSKRDELIKELDLVRDRTKEDKKRAVSSKDEIKSKLNRSPDYADAVMMRMFFEVNKSTGKYWYV